MALSKSILSFPTARWIARDLKNDENVAQHMKCLWFTKVSVAVLNDADLENGVKRHFRNENLIIRKYATTVLTQFDVIRKKAKKEEKEKEKESKNEPSGIKRKAEEKEETVPKKAKTEKLENMMTAELLAEKLKEELPRKPTSLEAMKILRSFGSSSATLLEEAEAIFGRKMKRVDEIWRLLILIKFGDCKNKDKKDIRSLYKELLKKEENK